MSLIMDEREREAPDTSEQTIEERLDAVEITAQRTQTGGMLAVLFAFLSMGAAVTVAVLLLAFGKDEGGETTVVQQGGDTASQPAASPDSPAHGGGASAEAEEFKRVDPTLPAVPAGKVKKFRLDVFEHVTKVAADKPSTRVWSYGVNGELYRGTGASAPMVVNQGDKVEITLVNGGPEEMDVRVPHSIDFHSSEIAPNKAFKTILPGEEFKFDFSADHPGVFMYHCATDPVLQHTAAGMVGMMVVKPKDLAPVDRELWMTQQEFYLGDEEGSEVNMDKAKDKNPDVIAFNGFGSQYKEHPIQVKKGEKIRMYVLNAGPSIWSAFHVIGTVFDRTVIEGSVGRDAQTVNLAPSQGGWVEFTLDDEGTFPFVTHAFGDMVKGGVGVLATEHAPKDAAH